MKILVLGAFHVNYRCENTITLLLKEKYSFQHIRNDYFLNSLPKISITAKIIKKLSNLISRLYLNLIIPYSVIKSDVVYYLPMSHANLYILLIAKLFRKKIIVDFYVSLFDSFVLDRKSVKKRTIKSYLLWLADRKVIKSASTTIFLNEAEKVYYTDLLNISRGTLKSEIIPLVVPLRKQALIPFFNGKKRKPTICWWGTFLNLHGLDNLIKAIEKLHKKEYAADFYLFGVKNGKEKGYQKLIKSLGLSEYVKLRTDLTFNNGLIAFLIQNCDLALGSFGDNEKAKNVLVNKIVDASSMGIPVITMKNQAVLEFFDDNSIIYTGNTPEEIAHTIEETTSSLNQTRKKGLSSRKIYNMYFSENKFYSKLNKTFIEVAEH